MILIFLKLMEAKRLVCPYLIHNKVSDSLGFIISQLYACT